MLEDIISQLEGKLDQIKEQNDNRELMLEEALQKCEALQEELSSKNG